MKKTLDCEGLINPFLASFSIKPRLMSMEFIIKGSGMEGDATFKSYKKVDVSRGSWYPGMDFMSLHNYTKPGLQVFGYILMHLRWNQDYIELKLEDAFDIDKPNKLVMKKSSFYNGISELIAKGIIAPRSKRVKTYWLNPDKFFLGNRLRTFPTHVVEPVKPTQEEAT